MLTLVELQGYFLQSYSCVVSKLGPILDETVQQISCNSAALNYVMS